jgi:hypothetical protein
MGADRVRSYLLLQIFTPQSLYFCLIFRVHHVTMLLLILKSTALPYQGGYWPKAPRSILSILCKRTLAPFAISCVRVNSLGE